MTKGFLDLRIDQILRDDITFSDVVNKRIAKLENYQSKLTEGHLKREVTKCIRLTKEGHKLAESLKKTYFRLAKTFPTEPEQAIDQVIAFLIKAATKSTDLESRRPKQSLKRTLSNHRDEYELAKQVILEFLSNKYETMLDVVNSKFPNAELLESISLKTKIIPLWSTFQIYTSTLSICLTFVRLSTIIRGVFYMGIVNIHGGELDRKVFINHLKDLGSEALGLIPGVGEVLSVINMTKSLIDTVKDLQGIELPEVVTEAQDLDLYFLKYQAALKIWKSLAKSEIAYLEKLRIDLQNYQ